MIVVTGGAGFIGANYLWNLWRKDMGPVVCVDKLTYAANTQYIQPLLDSGYVKLEQYDIANKEHMQQIMLEYKPEYIVNFAAESHVDNSIKSIQPFVDTNIQGTINLMQCALENPKLKKFLHVSTDEVYGSLDLDSQDSFREDTPYNPKNPYSATKAASDHLVSAFHNTYGLPAVITNCSNNYGPGQHKEKFIPTIITKALNNQKIPVYGDGMNVRDWLYVDDHCRGINLVLESGTIGEKYNIGGGTELPNIEIVRIILKKLEKSENLIEYVADRPGHDRRYSIDCSKIERELGYKPNYTFEQGLELTIEGFTK
jgi:dTDP-glucose 4,6-dehydratase